MIEAAVANTPQRLGPTLTRSRTALYGAVRGLVFGPPAPNAWNAPTWARREGVIAGITR